MAITFHHNCRYCFCRGMIRSFEFSIDPAKKIYKKQILYRRQLSKTFWNFIKGFLLSQIRNDTAMFTNNCWLALSNEFEEDVRDKDSFYLHVTKDP